MYNNYLFDLYGTLIDIKTNESKPSLWKKMALYMTLQGCPCDGKALRKAYYETIADYHKLHGANAEIDFQHMIPDLYRTLSMGDAGNASGAAFVPNQTQVADWALAFRTLSLEKLRLFPGAVDLLKCLHENGKKVYLLSNAQRLFTEPEMRSLGIYDLFDDIFYSSDIGYAKPSEEFYTALLSKHHMKPVETVMVGNDWQADAWGAHKNGLHSIYIHTEQSSEVTGALPEDCTVVQTLYDILTL